MAAKRRRISQFFLPTTAEEAAKKVEYDLTAMAPRIAASRSAAEQKRQAKAAAAATKKRRASDEPLDLNEVRAGNALRIAMETGLTLSNRWRGSREITDIVRFFVYYEFLEARLAAYIRQCTRVIGCMAWLTSVTLLEALKKVPEVSIVVQSEHWMLPVVRTQQQQHQDKPLDWMGRQRMAYESLPKFEIRNESGVLNETLSETALTSLCSGVGGLKIDAIRCAGELNRSVSDGRGSPRMHHKFLVLYNRSGVASLWVGTFNMTKNATLSADSALYIQSKQLVEAYRQEWACWLEVSTPLICAHTWTPNKQQDWHHAISVDDMQPSV